ncbi:MAG TPA: fatty acid desaturase, partial [Pirellulales bacterium]
MGDELCLTKLAAEPAAPAGEAPAPPLAEPRRKPAAGKVDFTGRAEGKTLNDPEFKKRLQELRQVDNVTNFFYIAGVWAIIALAIGGAVATHQYVVAQGASWLWSVPAFFAAIVVVGASQHQLAGATHEATHHILFRTRWLNELASDVLCMFPLFSTTYTFRLHHLAHHQYINSDWDPDRAQLTASGHWLDFPIASADFLKFLARQLWVPNLVRYMRVRIQHNSFRTDSNAYAKGAKKVRGIPAKIGAVCIFTLAPFMIWASIYQHAFLLAIVPPIVLGAALLAVALLPSSAWAEMRLKPVFSPRATGMMRMSFIITLFWAVSWVQLLTGAPAWAYLILLWVTP